MLKLHPVKEIRVYCGPGAIIAITGKPLPEVRSAINSVRGMKDNQGVTRLSLTHFKASLDTLGIKYEFVPCTERTTLSTLVSRILKKDVRYIVNITGHWVTVLNGFLIDNQYRLGTDVNDCRHKNKLVKNFMAIQD